MNVLSAQQDSLASKTVKPHSAKKATILSAVLPGAGQIYNKKYWKAPIAWAGMGTCIYFIRDNRAGFNLLRKDAILRQNYPDNYVSPITYRDLGTFAGTNAQLDQLVLDNQEVIDAMDKRKQWLDLSYFALAAVYGLQIIDANVDAHLFDYDISPDISLNIAPSFNPQLSNSAGVCFTFRYKSH